MKKGVDMTSKDNEGLTPLDIAKENRNEECIRVLFKAQKPEILVSWLFDIQHTITENIGSVFSALVV